MQRLAAGFLWRGRMAAARLALLLSLLSLSGYGSAVSMAGALELWDDGDRSAAIAAWHRLAEVGDVEAGLFLGHVYRRGLGVARDDRQALTWYRRAAERGHPEAQYELALMYELGLGVAPDPDEAAVWYGLSAVQACPAELRARERLGER